MIDCTPRGICSWAYLLHGEGHAAEITMGLWGEEGGLVADGAAYKICKKGGWLSGRWELLENGRPVVEAQKTSVLHRRFELSGAAGPGILEAAWAFRTTQLDGAGAKCRIRPVHAFTRRAVIEGSFEDFRVAAFAFWLTVLMWRRASGSNTGTGGAT